MAFRRRFVKALAVVAVALVVALIAVLVTAWRAPMATLAFAGRMTLRLAGFEKTSTMAPAGPIAYFRTGSGPTVIFLHGANDQAGTWARVAPTFRHEHHVVIADLAGHGDSAPLQGALTADDLFDGVDAIVKAEGGGKPVTLVGNSLGGWIALVYAVEHPDSVKRAVLVNGAINRGERVGAAVTLLPRTREEARKTIDVLMSPSTPRMPAFVLDDLVRRAPSSPLARLMAQPEAALARFLIDDRLESIRVPVTLIWGRDDRLLSIDYARTAAARIPGATLDFIPSCGHVPQRECPDLLLPRLAAVLAGDLRR